MANKWIIQLKIPINVLIHVNKINIMLYIQIMVNAYNKNHAVHKVNIFIYKTNNVSNNVNNIMIHLEFA